MKLLIFVSVVASLALHANAGSCPFLDLTLCIVDCTREPCGHHTGMRAPLPCAISCFNDPECPGRRTSCGRLAMCLGDCHGPCGVKGGPATCLDATHSCNSYSNNCKSGDAGRACGNWACDRACYSAYPCDLVEVPR